MDNRIGVIDVGTNSVLALGITKSGTILYNDYKISELGQGMHQNDGYLLELRLNVTFNIIENFVTELRNADIHVIKIIGTSASRDAKNIDILMHRIKSKLNIDYEIISGEKEAKYTYLGALSLVDDPSGRNFVMMDIGGGSTEVIYGNGHDIQFKTSFQLGVIRLKDMINKIQLSDGDILALKDHLTHFYKQLPSVPSDFIFMGIGGTFTTVAAMDQKMTSYNPYKVNGHHLSYDECSELFEHINSMDLKQRELVPGLEPKRAPLIQFGFRIFLEFMQMMNIKTLHFTDFGLRFGVAKNYFKNT